ncbi:metal-binding protein [Desulfonema ishimotonii]|uniref:Metal-binding protein n=1 Tax=Desulfonema ishimotonii TaxID=45657 RepID=A0A401FZH9_9BACT|nr:DUF2284 domain-containing protein [Desulfonema ishimotonii]GBC62389.1 metal-binding protein [Desulfonema ishimotonii]
MNKLPFQNSDPAHTDFQFLEDLSTAYWYSEALFAAIGLNLFDHIENGNDRPRSLSEAARCREAELTRLMRVLTRIELVYEFEGQWCNSQSARTFLLSESPDYMGDFLLYRQYMQPQWGALAQRAAREDRPIRPFLSRDDDYEVRNFHYVRSTDRLIRQKVPEILQLVRRESWRGPLLDIGGGAGTLGRALIRTRPDESAVLFDLPEVIRAARKIHPAPEDWRQLRAVGGDFRFHPFAGAQFGLIVMSNFLHAYNPDTARELLESALKLLRPDGLVLIHDYFPDRRGRSPHKGAFYDLNMMINTYDGGCRDAVEIAEWLGQAGMERVTVLDLQTDTSVILAGRRRPAQICETEWDDWLYTAREIGFSDARHIVPAQVMTAPWVRMKCRFGCRGYGKGLQCPPYSMPHDELRPLLESYSHALMVQGSPPGRDFHDKLLELERQAFLSEFHKALVFGAGPCPVCKTCAVDEGCKNPEKARPAMEACGIDVYETARNAGFQVMPVTERHGYVKYFGLLLME